jgi:hypothetical protein
MVACCLTLCGDECIRECHCSSDVHGFHQSSLELVALLELLEPLDPAAVAVCPAPFASIQQQPHPPVQQLPAVVHYYYPQRIALSRARMAEMELQLQL